MMRNIYLAIPLVCLLVAVISGLLGKIIGRRGAHNVTILGITTAFIFSLIVYIDVYNGNISNEILYIWGTSGGISLKLGFLIDQLSATMMIVVTFVSLMVHIYTIGYMSDDPGYQRFFCYISLFTFAMLMLVMSNNFLQLFFGWEAVGLISYLLIGFWYEKDTAIFANLKAFLVNRVGDFGFILGIAAIFYLFESFDYLTVFQATDSVKTLTVPSWLGEWKWITIVCLLLFVGAMGKSAQIPLHVWLPDSMEGPTPISALIHAATMVTAGIFMVARMSPLFELSQTALSTILIIGSTTALFMGLIAIVQNDIKRVVAYSTLSQLGYMTTALGASAFDIAIFHLGTHAFFKALLFLCAGSVIIAMHHQQDMRKMGGLRTIMPITYLTCLIGTLALVGIPPFAGFFSKDAIIEAVNHSTIWGSSYAYYSLLLGVFVTAFYSFRLLFMTFHGNNHADAQTKLHLQESPNVIILPLVILAIPSTVAGFLLFEPVITGSYFGNSTFALGKHNVAQAVAELYQGKSGFSLVLMTILHAMTTVVFWLAILGTVFAWYCYCKNPQLPKTIARIGQPLYRMLENKYGFDELYQTLFAKGSVSIGKFLHKNTDAGLIDGVMVNGTAKMIGQLSNILRHMQTGLIYNYAFAMIIGLFILTLLYIWF